MRSRSAVMWRHVLPTVLAVLFLLPLVAMVVGSLRPGGAAPPSGIELIPTGATTESFVRLTQLLPIVVYLRNSVVVTVLAVPMTVLIAALAGFGIRLLSSRAKRTVIIACLLVLLIPGTALWVTRFQVYATLGLIGSVLPLVAPALLGTTPLLVLIYTWAFHGISDSQLHAAMLEGAGPGRIWRTVAMPQVTSATLAVSVLAFTFHWGNFIDALLYLRGQQNFTLPLGLDTLKLLRPTEFPLLMAGAVVFTLPSIAVFLLAHRLFTDDPVAAIRGHH